LPKSFRLGVGLLVRVVLVLILVGCVPRREVRSFVAKTDMIEREPVYHFRGIPMLLEAPRGPHRAIGSVVAYHDAAQRDQHLLDALADEAERLGATGLWIRRRDVVTCRTSGGSEFSLVNNGTMTFASGSVEPARAFECVRIEADMLLLPDDFDCGAEQICRVDRTDANTLALPAAPPDGAPPGRTDLPPSRSDDPPQEPETIPAEPGSDVPAGGEAPQADLSGVILPEGAGLEASSAGLSNRTLHRTATRPPRFLRGVVG
jgi:hypothetical protein